MISFGLASCASPRPNAPELDEPVFGSAHPTTFVVASREGSLHAQDLATVARVLRRYKTLDEAERALVKSAVARRLNALVALEVQQLKVQKQGQREAIRKTSDPSVMARRLAQFDAALKMEAEARVAQRLGHLLAVPLKTSDNLSPVAFARIGSNGLEIGKDASEVDVPLERLVEGSRIRASGGEFATAIASPPVAISAAR